MKVILTGGGTGGHLFPGLAIVEALENLTSCRVCYVGTARGLEAGIIPQKGYQFRKVWISGIRRGRFWGNFLFPLKMAVSLIQSLWLVSLYRPDVIIGTGAYVSWPVLTAGILLRRVTVIQEQNKKPGLVTRTVAPFVDAVHLSFKGSIGFFRKKSNLHVSGNPTRRNLDAGTRKDGYERFNLDAKKTTLFVFGGSQGAWSVNQAIMAFVQEMIEEKQVQVLWAAGPLWADAIKKATDSCRRQVKVFPFISEMGLAYKISDLVICRSGATTIAEITRVGVPAVFVPFPNAAGGHQEENARELTESGASAMVLEEDVKKGLLKEVVFQLIDNPSRRKEMAEKTRQFGMPDASDHIAGHIMQLVNR